MFYLQLNRQDDPSPTLWGHKFRVTRERCFFPYNIIRRFFSQYHAKTGITPSKWKKNRRPLLRNRTSEVKGIDGFDQATRDALPLQKPLHQPLFTMTAGIAETVVDSRTITVGAATR
jgi:hypothetical protein